MDGMIIRFDDISANTDLGELTRVISLIREEYPSAKVMVCVNILCQSGTDRGEVYNGVPFKDNETKWFFNVDTILPNITFNDKNVVIASHGLLHFDHSKTSYLMQEMSIVTSCRLLKTNIFVAPFGRVNQDTIHICKENGIELIYGESWMSLDFHLIDTEYDKWYCHLWKLGFEKLCQRLKLGTRITRP